MLSAQLLSWGKTVKALYYPVYLLAGLFLFGCTITDGSSVVTGEARASISADKVRIYRVAPEAYEEIAMISASAGHDFKKDSSLMNSAIQRLKEEAAKVGANGVLLSGINERDAPTTTVSVGSGQVYNNSGDSVYATGSGTSVNRGDAYTRVKGLAIFVP